MRHCGSASRARLPPFFFESFGSRYLLSSLLPSSTLPWVAPYFLPSSSFAPVALRDEDLIVRWYGRMHTRIREVRLLALAEVFKGPWSLR